MKSNVSQLYINMMYTIKEALILLDKTAKGILLVIDSSNRLLGTITDGDIRRALIRGESLEDKVEKIVHRNPVTAKVNATKEEIKELFIRKAVKQIPILDENDTVVDLISINDILLPEGKDNIVVVMAGGLGTRLRDLTKEIPKPMLKVGNDPILQHIVNNFKQYGYNKFLISVNYKSEIIENYFQDGYPYGVKIEYIKEHQRLGTAGGILLAKDYLDKPFFVINGDIFTNLNVDNMMNFHTGNGFDITIGTRKHSFQIQYGVVEVEGNVIKGLKEKPVIDYLISGGVYCINPDLISLIPEGQYFDITDLISICIKEGKKVGSFEIKDYWMDIGKLEDYNKVNEDVYSLICCDKS